MLRVRHLTVAFGALTASDDVALDIGDGKIVGLIGPNGAGKTTVIGAISGYVLPTVGSIKFDEHELVGLSSYRRARLGIGRTFQHVELFDSMTVLNNVIAHCEVADGPLLMLTRKAARRDQAMGILDSLGLARIAHRIVSQLAYPERKLTEFARAIAGNIRLILLDEPTAGVSIEERMEVVARVRDQMRSRKIAGLVVEHDMGVVQHLCDDVYVMESGKIIANGTFESIVADPRVRRAYLG